MSAKVDNNIQRVLELENCDISRLLGLNTYEVVKNQDGRLVIETPKYFYKIKELKKDDPTIYFEQIVYKSIANEYQKAGLVWDYFTVENSEKSFSVERREKLRVLTPDDCSLDEAIKTSSFIFRRVERRLRFPNLISQLNQHLCDDVLNGVVLARACHPSIDDFATHGEDIIMLGNSRLFLAIQDENGKWDCSFSQFIASVALKFGEFYFAPKEFFLNTEHVLGDLICPVSHWWLFPRDIGDLIGARRAYLQNAKEMFSANIKLLSSKKVVPITNADDFKDDSMLEFTRSLSGATDSKYYLFEDNDGS